MRSLSQAFLASSLLSRFRVLARRCLRPGDRALPDAVLWAEHEHGATAGSRYPAFAPGLLPFACCLLLLALSSCGKADPYGATERAIRRTLPEYIGPADSYAVRIARSETSLLGGKIGWIEIEGRNVRATDALTVDALHVRLDDVHFKRGDRSITSVGSSAITARISAASATRYVANRGTQYEGTRFEFLENEAVVYVTPALLGIRLPVKVSGRPRLRGDDKIDFDTSHLSLSLLPLPSPLMSLLERRINPILDLTTLHLPLSLNGVHIERGFAVITGTARLGTAR